MGFFSWLFRRKAKPVERIITVPTRTVHIVRPVVSSPKRKEPRYYDPDPVYSNPFYSPVHGIPDPTPMPSNDRGAGWFDGFSGGSSGGAGGGSSWGDCGSSSGGDSGGCGGGGGGD